MAGGVPPNSREPFDEPSPDEDDPVDPEGGDPEGGDPTRGEPTGPTGDGEEEGTPTGPDKGEPIPPGGGGATPPGTGGGGVPTPTDPRDRTLARKAGASEELRSWQEWWRVNEDRYLRVRSRFLAAEERGATAGPDAPAEAAEAPVDEARRLLFRSLKDREWSVRSSAAVALGRAGETVAFHQLLRLHVEPRRDVRRSAGIGLGMLHEPIAATEIGGRLFDPAESEELRAVAALSLGLLGGGDATGLLVRFLDPASDSLRQGGLRRTRLLEEASVQALGLTGETSSTALLMRTLADGNARSRTRAFAAEALARLGERKAVALLLQALRADAEPIRRSAAAALGVLARPADDAAVAALAEAARKDGDFTTRRFAILSLGRIGGEGAGARLQREMGMAAKGERPFAALALGIARVKDATPALRSLFRSEADPDTKAAMAVALGLLEDKESGKELAAGARTGPNPEIRCHYLTALALAGHADAVGIAREVLAKEKYDGLLRRAALCLAVAGEPEAIPQLCRLAREGCCTSCRAEAARTLGRLGSRRAIPALLGFVKDGREVPLRREAVWALGRILDGEEESRFSRLGMDGAFPLFRGPVRSAMKL